MTTKESAMPKRSKRDNRLGKPRAGLAWLGNRRIGSKLTLGFGLLVLLTLVLGVSSYLNSTAATGGMRRVDAFNAPAALNSSYAQAALLRMLGDVHVYIALGDQQSQDNYARDSRDFRQALDRVEAQASQFNDLDKSRLKQLKEAFATWSTYPNQLFDLRNSQIDREPAYRLLSSDGLLLGGTILIDTNNIIEAQGRREPTAEALNQSVDLARFQGSFAGMLGGMRGYVTTRSEVFRQEYESNRALNETDWNKLAVEKDKLTASQQATLDQIAQNRNKFLNLQNPMFQALEGPRWREDLYLFQTEAEPAARSMLLLLGDITSHQQQLLRAELITSTEALMQANQRTLAGSLAAVVLGLLLALMFRENIAGPIRRLTHVAEEISSGELDAQAQVEFRDEIGILAATFNRMTGQLRQTLGQIRKEKKRADDLLGVVIPIGVQLSGAKDFNHLLEQILSEAKSFCRADAGNLYLRTEGDQLQLMIVRHDTLNIAAGGTTGQKIPFEPLPLCDENMQQPDDCDVAIQVARHGVSINTADAYGEPGNRYADARRFDQEYSYRHRSILTLPLKNGQNQVVGVLQLVNAQDPDSGQVVPFDSHLQQMMESLSALAGVALDAYIRELALRQEIEQLRIEVDDVKRQKQVDEIVETDFFQNLQIKARQLRERNAR